MPVVKNAGGKEGFMNGYVVAGLMIYFLCLMVSSLFHGYKAALMALSESALKEKEEEGHPYVKFVTYYVEHDKNFTRIVSIADACIYIFMGAFATWAFFNVQVVIPQFSNHPDLLPEKLVILAIGIVLVLFMEVIGVVIPLRIGNHNPEKWSFGQAGRVKILCIPFIPLSWIINGMAWVGLKLFGIDLHAAENVTEEEIISIVNEGHEQGVLQASEAEMISNIFGFSEKYAKAIMTHRSNIISLDGSIILDQAMEVMLNGNFSRYPVYVEDADDVVGILYFRDAVAASQMPRYKRMPIKDIPGLLRETMFIPEIKSVNILFQEMQKQKIHMATVIDEYGQIAGIVTMEDIIEEIVGNIQDEYDEEEEVIEEKEDGSFLMDGIASMSEVEDMLGIEMEDVGFETLNGFLISKLDRIPENGETPEVIWENYKFQILEVDGRVIRQVCVKKEEIKPEEVETEEEDSKKSKKEDTKSKNA